MRSAQPGAKPATASYRKPAASSGGGGVRPPVHGAGLMGLWGGCLAWWAALLERRDARGGQEERTTPKH